MSGNKQMHEPQLRQRAANHLNTVAVHVGTGEIQPYFSSPFRSYRHSMVEDSVGATRSTVDAEPHHHNASSGSTSAEQDVDRDEADGHILFTGLRFLQHVIQNIPDGFSAHNGWYFLLDVLATMTGRHPSVGLSMGRRRMMVHILE